MSIRECNIIKWKFDYGIVDIPEDFRGLSHHIIVRETIRDYKGHCA